MECMFDKCYDAVNRANSKKSFGVYYSEKQDPDMNIHIHDCCEVLLCISGGKNFLINDKVYDVEPSDLFIINQFEAHKITYNPECVFSRYVMQVHPQFLYTHSSEETDLSYCFYSRNDKSSNKISLTPEELSEMLFLINKFKRKYPYGDDLIKTSAATELLSFINGLFCQKIATKKEPSNPGLKKAMDYINDNFRDKLLLEDIAENSYISVNSLCRLFSRYCGTTVSKYITSKRITEAKKLLSEGKSVTDTALMCGFEDYANFIRVFKKHVGVTPGKYIK